MAQTQTVAVTKKDYLFGVASGLFIGLLMLPILKAAKPDIYQKFSTLVVPFFLIGVPAGLVVASFIARKIAIIWQVAKFGVIGVLNTLVDIGSLALLTFIVRAYAHTDAKATFAIGAVAITVYSVLKAITFIIANINSYYWNKYWTFNQNPEKKTRTQFIQFFAVSIIGFIINVLVATLIFKTFGSASVFTADQQGLLGAAAGSIAGLVWNFIGYKFIVFKEPVSAA